MLNTIMFEVLGKVLDGNIFSTDCYLSKVNNRRMLSITLREKLSYNEFVQKVKNIILEDHISGHDNFLIEIDLTDELINSVMTYVTVSCLNEFEDMKKK